MGCSRKEIQKKFDRINEQSCSSYTYDKTLNGWQISEVLHRGGEAPLHSKRLKCPVFLETLDAIAEYQRKERRCRESGRS